MESGLIRHGREREEERHGPRRGVGDKIAQQRRVKAQQHSQGDRPKAGQTLEAPGLPLSAPAPVEGRNEKRHLMLLGGDGCVALRNWDR
jgi:hypothetical protein